MAEDQAAAAAVADDEVPFEAPERGSADELLDAGAHAPDRRDAPQHGARHGRGGPRPVPGREARHRAGDRERLLLRLRAAAAADARRPRGDRGAHGQRRQGRPPVRPPRGPVRGGSRARGAGRPVVQGRDPRRPRRQGRRRPASRCPRRPSTTTGRSATCARARTSNPPARSGRSSCSRSPARTGAATRSGRCSSASTARSGRRQEELDQFLWRREEAKKRDHRKLGVQLDLFSFHDVSPGCRVLAPQGPADLDQTLETPMRELQERRGYEEVYTPLLVHQKLWERVRPLGRSTATTCSSSRSRTRRSASSR